VIITGTVFKLGDHINTDVILPGRYLSIREPAELGRHCLEGLDPTFAGRVRPNDIIAAGRNFGSGSSREQAPIALKAAGISCVVAVSFARIFYRNAINIGLSVIVCSAFSTAARDATVARLDLDTGNIDYEGHRYSAEPLPENVRAIVAAGGLTVFVQRRLRRFQVERETKR
jgi:3-isopropylmalate/(R)-2-methylmalate dehydratase small subunit